VVRLISLIHDQASSFEVLQLKIKLFCSRVSEIAVANAVIIRLRQTVSCNQALPENVTFRCEVRMLHDPPLALAHLF
jgi:hypothetical protein